MCPVLALSPKWHVIPTYCMLVRDRLILSAYPDFLVRLSVKRLPSPRTGSGQTTYTLVPDGLQHPKFKGLDSRKGHYVVCRRAVLEVDSRGTTFSFTHSQHLKKSDVELRNRILFFLRESLFPSPRVRRDQAALLIARIYRPPSPSPYSPRTRAIGRAGAGSPARSRGISTVAEALLERILSSTCR